MDVKAMLKNLFINPVLSSEKGMWLSGNAER